MAHGLGFRDDDDLDRGLATFSGGAADACVAGAGARHRPDVLLLDEPTNHLDIESLEWLEQTLVALDAAIVLVAHDRWFLETVGTAVLELEAGRSRFFAGSWHAVAARAGGARAGARAGDRARSRPRSRGIGALHRALPRRRRGPARRSRGSRRSTKIERIERDPARRRGARRSSLDAPSAQRPRHLRARRRADRGRRSRRSCCSSTRAVARARRARLARRAERLGKTTLIETLDRAAGAPGGQAAAPATT